jgi:hypothetical protein
MSVKISIITILVTIAIVILIVIFYYYKNADAIVNLIAHGAKVTEFLRSMPYIKESEKKIEEWKYLAYRSSVLPYLFLSRHSDQQVKYLIIMHGSTWPLEYCYNEYKEIADQHSVSIISLEYPGFGDRYNKNKDLTTEEAMLTNYIEEVIHLAEHLQLEWENIAIVGQCFGAACAIRLAAHPKISTKLHALCLTKPFTSLHDVLQEMWPISSLCSILPNIFESESNQHLKSIYCHFYCIQGEMDKITSAVKAEELVSKMVNCKSRHFHIVPDDHSLLMLKCINIIHHELFPLEKK